MQSDNTEDGSKANSEPPVTKTEGAHRGSLDNWLRGKPDGANEAAGDADTAAGDSTEKAGNPRDKETPTFRDGKPRD